MTSSTVRHRSGVKNAPLLLWLSAVAATAVLSLAAFRAWRAAPIITASTAQRLCGDIFVSRRDERVVLANDDRAGHRFVSVAIDYAGRAVSASILGLAHRRAFFRDGLGCTLEIGFSEQQIRAREGDRLLAEPLPPSDDVGAATAGEPVVALTEVFQDAFSNSSAAERQQDERAIVVVYDGHIVAERYAPGISGDTPLPGDEMSALAVNALVGILVGQRVLALDAPAQLAEWQQGADPRRAITLGALLHMSSGLEFVEDGELLADRMLMLYGQSSAAAFAAAKPLLAPPGSRWSYSSGSTNIIMRLVRDALGGSAAEYLGFPRQALFNRIGMQTALIESDPAGNLLGSTFMYASAPDWTRLGELYLRDGVWEGTEILPAGWIDFSLTPAPAATRGDYGAHIWLNVGRAPRGDDRLYPHVPPDAFFAIGRGGQVLAMVPSRKTVVVRLGFTRESERKNLDAFIAAVLDALPAE